MNGYPPSIKVYFRRLPGEGLPQIPYKRHASDAGWDLYTSREQFIRGGKAGNIHTDITLAIPEGWFGHLLARSSTIRNYGLAIQPAVIDSGFRGELFMQALNLKESAVVIRPGMRLAQLVFIPVPEVTWRETSNLPRSDRGEGGFGSTGT
jgi:dUTP pyrophosphatase